MFRFIKGIIILWVSFVVVSVAAGGGDHFRTVFKEVGWISGKVTDFIADKADRFKEDADAIVEFVKGGRKKSESST
jgi:hypothetical protein